MSKRPMPPHKRLVFSQSARADLQEIRRYTRRVFGDAALERYDLLLKQAFIDLADDPQRPGSQARPELGSGIRSYHIALSKARANVVVRKPRHFILYFQVSAGEIVISRVLSDERDLKRHRMDRTASDRED